MFVGYASNHKVDCYRMWNPQTKKVPETCDVVSLNRMYLQAPENTMSARNRTHKTLIQKVSGKTRGGVL
jgi:hypothetical protein